MRRTDIYSLFWLTRWFNGRKKRLDEQVLEHHSNLRSLLLDALDEPCYEIKAINLLGFLVTADFSSENIEILSIIPPKSVDYVQLLLFSDDELEGLEDEHLVSLNTRNSVLKEVSSL